MYSNKKDKELEDICAEDCVHSDAVNAVRKKLAPTNQLFDLADLFKALGDSTRIRLLNALIHSELCVCDLVDLVGMSQSAVSHQLRVLRSAKIVKHRKEGKNVYYSLDDNHIRQLLSDGLDHVNEIR